MEFVGGIERIVRGAGFRHGGRLRRVRHRDGDQRLNPESVGSLRRDRIAADVRKNQPLWSDGAFLDAGSSGPLCRYAEDCAVVMSVIARPDGRDMSVSDIPFNWNAHLDIRKLRVGYLKDAFDETKDAALKGHDDKALEQVQALGVKLIPLKVPDWNVDVASIGVESAVFFDELVRSGNDKKLTNAARANGFRASRVVPAVEYLQSQRARAMMMGKLAEATADVDVYLCPGIGGGPPLGAAAAAGRPRTQSVTQRHFTMANLACYPAVAVPHGFSDAGTPSSITFYGRPFGEGEVLAVAKAYQDA